VKLTDAFIKKIKPSDFFNHFSFSFLGEATQ